MIKQISVLFATFCLSATAIAQPDVTSAYNANKAGKFEEAVTYIEKAMSDPKATSKEKTWRYRGNIYLNIAKDPALSEKFPNAASLSQESYFKAMEVDAAGDYKEENKAALADLQVILLTKAGKQYETSDFCGAAGNFESAKLISEKFGITDSVGIFNTAYCSDRCGNLDKALTGYKKSAELGYNVPAVYLYMSEVYTKQGKIDEAKKVLADARAKYPKDVELLRGEVNFMLNDQQYDKALDLLKSLAASDPKNETVWFVLGATHEKLGNVTEQEKAYKTAVDLKPNYFDALFNLGATYYNQGVEQMKECDKIPPRETAKYDDCAAKSKVYFTKSIEFLERAYKERPEDRDIISALSEGYLRVDNTEGHLKMKALLNKQ